MVFAALAFQHLNRPISMVSSLLAASLMGNRDMPPLIKDEQGDRTLFDVVLYSTCITQTLRIALLTH